MADQAGADDYVCPNCSEPVNPDWKACPSCGVEFADAEDVPAPPPPPPKPATPPAAAKPAAPKPPVPPAKPAAPPAAAKPPAPPPKAAPPRKPADPPPPKAPEPEAPHSKPAGESKFPLAFITRRFGKIGLLGLPAALAGVFGLVAAMNWDTWFGGQSSNLIGPKQMNAMLGAIAVAGLGVFLTVLGMVRARAHPVRATEELSPAAAPERAPVMATVAPPPTRVTIPEIEAAPELAPEPGPLEDEEEEEDEFVIPSTPSPPVSPAPPARAEAFAAPPPAPAAPPRPAAPAPSPPAAERDELEDLFGELESEVAKAEEDEIHYECPNCHGIVREDDASCPHCHVTFES